MGFRLTSSGSFDNLEKFLKRATSGSIFASLSKYGQMGVDALSAATPVDSGLTSGSWTYEIVQDSKTTSIIWGNTNVVDGTPVAVLLQVGHGTGTGGYVQGIDYINPALKPVFDQLAEEVWREVTK